MNKVFDKTKSHFLSKSPVKQCLLRGPPTGPLWRSCSITRASGLFIHSYF